MEILHASSLGHLVLSSLLLTLLKQLSVLLHYGYKMTISARSSLIKMSRAKGQSSGWAAFDLKQRQKPGLESEVDKDPFPAISRAPDSLQLGEKLLRNKHIPVKSFSSVLLPSKNFPALKENGNSKTTMSGCDSSGKYCSAIPPEDVTSAIKKLGEQHHWAESNLIEDVLAAVNNDVTKASTLLETMGSSFELEKLKFDSSVILGEHKVASVVKSKSDESTIPRPTTLHDVPLDEKPDRSLFSENLGDLTLFSSSPSDHPKENNKDLGDGKTSPSERFSHYDNLRCNAGLLNSVPVEPEWVEDDVYISHRMNALRTMR